MGEVLEILEFVDCMHSSINCYSSQLNLVLHNYVASLGDSCFKISDVKSRIRGLDVVSGWQSYGY